MITDKQKQLLLFIKDFQNVNGRIPTFNEMSSAFGISIGAIQARLYTLQNKKLIKRKSFYDIEIL